ncbi:MAG: SH3 domain-containing protein [Desulfobacteraceae bacterium]|nr:SH3 domain-containing protein [Desulfobacteraceae bacterium]
MPARESVQLASGSSSDTVAHEAPTEEYSKLPSEAIGSQATTPLERTDNARLASPAGVADQQNVLSSPKTEKRPVKDVEKGGSIVTREDIDPKPPADEKAMAQEIALGPDVTAKTEKGSSQKVDKASLQAGSEPGKRLFVKVHVGNVREEPSMTSRVKLRLEMGDPVTVVTGKRRGWVSVKLDDGRFGWVYHTLLTDAIVPQKATVRVTREIKAIRPEVAAKGVVKVIFELNGPFPPQIMIVEGEKPRVVCDFFDAGLASDIGDSIEVNNGIVEKIRTGMHKWPKFKVRVVLDLVSERNYEVDKIFLEKENYYVLVVKAKE